MKERAISPQGPWRRPHFRKADEPGKYTNVADCQEEKDRLTAKREREPERQGKLLLLPTKADEETDPTQMPAVVPVP